MTTENKHHIGAMSLPGGKAIGPYSDAVRHGSLIFLSGRIGLDSAKELVVGGVGEQTRQCLANINEVLTAAGVKFENIVKTTIFLTNMTNFHAINAVYGEVFANHRPARSTAAVSGLPMGALIEIEAIAAA